MTLTEHEVVALIKKDDESIKAALTNYAETDLKPILDKLRKPVKLTFAQKTMARIFGVDVPNEQNRLIRLINESLNGR